MDTAPTTSLTVPPEYHPSLFVNRETEIELVLRRAKQLVAGKALQRRTVIFRGERGCGKSWLLLQLAQNGNEAGSIDTSDHRVLASIAGVCPFYVSLTRYNEQTPEDATRKIIVALREQVGAWQDATTAFLDVADLSLMELSNLLVGDVNGLLRTRALVVLLDHVFETRPAILELLEDRLLAPLAVLPRVLTVMAGRGRGFSWKTPELRIHADEYWLRGLGEPATQQPLLLEQPAVVSERQRKSTQEQLERLDRAGYRIDKQVDEILAQTLGYPLSNCLLATGQGLGNVLEELLKEVSKADRLLLELVCVLRFFGELQVRALLDACRGDPGFDQLINREPRDVIEQLLETKLVRYDTTRAAYMLDEVIRRPLELNLLESQQDCWQRLHCMAWRMYQRWAECYQRAQKRLQDEAIYHKDSLERAGYASDTCPEP